MRYASSWRFTDPASQYIIYLRKSRKDMEAESLGQTDTLKRHRAALLALAERLGLNVVEICEEVVTGDSIAVRPEMQHVLQLIETGAYAGVLVMEIERLARGATIDQGIIAQTFKYSDTKIITPNKIYDPNNEMDEEYFEFGLFMSRREYNTIKRRLIRGREASLKEGKWIAGKTPFGWTREKIPGDKGYRLAPHPEQAPILKNIYDWYTGESGPRLGAKAISSHLNALGIPTNAGGAWVTSSVLDVIRNPVNAGWIKSGGRPAVRRIEDGVVKVSRPRTKPADLTLYKGLHAGLVSQEQFDRAVAISYASQNPPLPNTHKISNPLAGLVRCSVCGHVMRRTPLSYNRGAQFLCPTYHCPTVSSSFPEVEEAVLDALRGWLHALEIGEREHLQDDSAKATLEAALNAAQKRLSKVEHQQAKAYELVETGIYTPEVYVARVNSLQTERDELLAEISDRRADLEKIERARAAFVDLAPAVRRVLETYPVAESAEEKNDLMKSVLEKVVYTKTSKSYSRSGSDMSITIFPLVH